MVAALRAERNSVGVEIDHKYCKMAARYLKAEAADLFTNATVSFEKATTKAKMAVQEDCTLRDVRPAKAKLG